MIPVMNQIQSPLHIYTFLRFYLYRDTELFYGKSIHVKVIRVKIISVARFRLGLTTLF